MSLDIVGFYRWLEDGRMRGAQDLLVGAYGSSMRIDGSETPYSHNSVSPEVIQAFCEQTLPKVLPAVPWERRLAQNSSLDWIVQNDSVGRVRVHLARSGGLPILVFRYLEENIPSQADLGLPGVLTTWALRRHGVILVGGITDSGKTTATASLVKDLLELHSRRVLTIEDPVEYRQRHPSIIQKEIGVDVDTPERAIADAKRERPDVIVFGEIRSVEMARGLVASAESGHITIGTTHLSDMSYCCEALESYFPADERFLFRTMFARQLIGGIGMTLVKKATRDASDRFGRVLASEILVNNTAIANNIREGAPATDIRQLMIHTETPEMRTLEQHLSDLLDNSTIELSAAEDAAVYKDDLVVKEAA